MPREEPSRPMEIRQLKYFLAISELGSFSKAAVVLAVTQPVLSRHIRALEEELGIELLYRNGRGIVLTQAGTLLVDRARTIMETATKLTGEINIMRTDPCGGLILAMPPVAGCMLTIPLIQRFKEAYPHVRLHIQEMYSGYVLEWLATGRVDIGLLYNAPKVSTLVTQPLIKEELMLVGSPNTPKELRDQPVSGLRLAELPLTLPSYPHGLRTLVETRLAAAGAQANVQFEIDSLPSCLLFVQSGAAYTILPYGSIHSLVSAGKLVAIPIVDPRLTGEFVIATSTQRPVTALTQILVKTVAKLVRDLVAEGAWRLAPASRTMGAHGGTSSPETSFPATISSRFRTAELAEPGS